MNNPVPEKDKKLPPWQQTYKAASDPQFSAEENFCRFLDTLEMSGTMVDRRRSRVLGGGHFSFDMRVTVTRVATVVWFTCDPATVCARWKIKKSEQAASVLLSQTVHGRQNLFALGAAMDLAPGQFVLTLAGGDLACTFTEAGEYVAIAVTEDYFITHSGFHSQIYYFRPWDGTTPIQRFFARHFAALVRDIGNIDARDASDVSDSIFCLVRPVLIETDRLFGKSMAEGRSPDHIRAAALEAMYHRFTKPRLTVDDIASEVGVTGRYLCKLFRATGTTVMKTLMDLRLRRASVQLSEPHMAEFSVADIARKNGFCSSTHFIRQFKSKYGVTPERWRRKFRE